MRADLLLTTQNRHAELRRLLDSLCRQQTAAFRLIAGIYRMRMMPCVTCWLPTPTG